MFGLALLPSAVIAGPITASNWALIVGLSGPGGTSAGNAFSNIPSPFVNSHSATLGNSTSSAAYNITYDADSLDFLADLSLTCQGSPPFFRSSASGSFRISTTIPLLLRNYLKTEIDQCR